MKCSLWEHHHAIGVVLITNLTSARLRYEFGDHAAFDDDTEFRGTGMSVWGIEATIAMNSKED
jgi:hypothetical protein